MSEPEFKVRLALHAAISPSEDPKRVGSAIENVVGEVRSGGVRLTSRAELETEDPRAVIRIRDQLRDRHVRAAARKQMLLNAEGGSTSLMLNRQAATVGVIALCGSPEESPLGPIYLRIESEDLEAAIDWLTAYSG